MHKKNILNLLLLVVVISLATLIYFTEEKSTEFEKLSLINTSGVTTIVIQHNKNITEIHRQKNDQWSIAQPINIDANNFRIGTLLELLNAPIHSKYSVTEINLNSIGLAQANTSIKFDDMLVEFGINNPATGLRYIRLDNFIYTIEDVFYPLLSSDFSTLVSLQLLPTNSNITKLILGNQIISKDINNFWKSNITITADNINATIDHWKNNQAFGVHKYFEREPADISGHDEIFIYLESQKQAIRFLVTDTDPWLILARPEIDIEYHLDIKAYDQLIMPQ